MNERRVTSGAVSLAVREWGDPSEPTIILVHGYPDTSEMWRPLAELLSAHFHVVAYDVRGAGASTTPPRKGGYAMELLAADLAVVAGAVAPGKRVHVVGHDWGSIQSWAAVCTPDVAAHIASFTSISGPSVDHVARWIQQRRRHLSVRGIRQLIAQGRRSWYIGAFRLPGIKRAFTERTAAGFARYLEERENVPHDDRYPAKTFAADGAHGVELYREMATRLRRPRGDRTDVPVLVIVPTRDRWVSPALLDGIERTAPDLRRVDIDAGHWAPRSDPPLIAGLVEEFVSVVEGAPGSERMARARVPKQSSDLTRRIVVVTGAASGIGRATLLAYARRGAEVVAADIDGDGAARTAAEATGLGVTAHHFQVDVGDTDAMETFAKWVEHEVGTPDIVVNNAGIGMGGPILQTEVADWERVLHVNLWGVIHGCRLFARQMVARGTGGHIVNIASGAAFSPGLQFPAYATTKAAVLMLSESLRVELAPHHIGVSAICPGIVDTGIVTRTRFVGRDADDERHVQDSIQKMYARRRYGPDKVAKAIVRAVERNQAVVPVGPEAHAGRFIYRAFPSMARRIGSVDVAARAGKRKR